MNWRRASPLRLIAVDPGLQGTGVAIFKIGHPRPLHADVLRSHAGRKADWIDRVESIVEQVYELSVEYNVRHAVCEMMEMHQSPRAQMMWKSGDLQRTLFLVGSMHGQLTGSAGVVHFRVTPPSEWKGQLPKSVTINRINRLLGKGVGVELGIQTHAWDAVGIGLWHMGFLK